MPNFKTPDVLTTRQQDLIDELFTKHTRERAVGMSCWRIRWCGVFIKTYSGKTSWKTEGHAKSAFLNHLRRSYLLYYEWEKIVQNNPNIPYQPWASEIGRMKDYILKSGKVEFVEVLG
jgi:hypothetical protein